MLGGFGVAVKFSVAPMEANKKATPEPSPPRVAPRNTSAAIAVIRSRCGPRSIRSPPHAAGAWRDGRPSRRTAGEPHGAEGQALCWCTAEELEAGRYEMPPADIPLLPPVLAAMRQAGGGGGGSVP